jgi:hypothetical protein
VDRGRSLEDDQMKNLLVSAAVAGSLALGGCTSMTNPAYDHQIAGMATGAAIGAGVGALAGSVIPGFGTGAGAAVGAVLGGVVGAAINGRQYYRDTRGYCYYVDEHGMPHYSYDVHC